MSIKLFLTHCFRRLFKDSVCMRDIKEVVQELYIGSKIRYFSKKELEYEIDTIIKSDHPDAEQLIPIIVYEYTEKSLVDVLHKLQSKIPIPGDNLWRVMMRKLRYKRLNVLALNRSIDNETLLEKIERVYADMGYPQDMNSFIYYMSRTDEYDPSLYTPQENRARLEKLFREFMIAEEKILSNKDMSKIEGLNEFPYLDLLNGTQRKELGFQCCFCSKGIESTDIDPCNLDILINIDKPKNKQSNQIFYCHIACFESKLHENIAKMLVVQYLDDEEE
jgi:hypothetical protein